MKYSGQNQESISQWKKELRDLIENTFFGARRFSGVKMPAVKGGKCYPNF